MIIYVGNWRRKVVLAFKILTLLIVFGLIVPMIAMINIHIPTTGEWLQMTDGQMMREERKNQTQFDKVMDQFVIKLQDFYYEERE